MNDYPHKIYQIIDANLNRCREGLRVIEEVARFILENKPLQRKTKEIRHKISAAFLKPSARNHSARRRLIELGRDSVTDIGKDFIAETEGERTDLSDVIQSNFSRVEESVRVLEEFGKLLDSRGPKMFKKLRFEIYTLEKDYLSHIDFFEKKSLLKNLGLYCIIDKEIIGRKNPLSVAEEMVRGGARLIQYRDKISDDNYLYRVCKRLQNFLQKKGVVFIVNDRVDVAFGVDADGVHLGQEDTPVSQARKLLGTSKIIGKSTHSLQQALTASKQQVDYIAVGSIFPTITKQIGKIVGSELLQKVNSKVNLPVMAIGGINEKNIYKVVRQRPDGVAIVSAILTAKDIANKVRYFAKKLKTAKK